MTECRIQRQSQSLKPGLLDPALRYLHRYEKSNVVISLLWSKPKDKVEQIIKISVHFQRCFFMKLLSSAFLVEYWHLVICSANQFNSYMVSFYENNTQLLKNKCLRCMLWEMKTIKYFLINHMPNSSLITRSYCACMTPFGYLWKTLGITEHFTIFWLLLSLDLEILIPKA